MKNALFIFLSFVSFAFAGPREEAEIFLERASNEAVLTTRLELISRNFLGLPYGDGGPLGEGPEGRYDQDPLYRFDTFDCTTFVETIMALALSREVSEFENTLNHIRYDQGEVDYLKRNHFTDLWWIPNNIENGFMTDITRQIGGTRVLTATAEINLPGWLKKIQLDQIQIPYSVEERQVRLEELRSMNRFYKVEIASVPYVSINWILNNPSWIRKIPHGAVVNFVRPNWNLSEQYGSNQNISHQAFLFWKGNTLIQRHASTSNPKKVVDVPFLEYIAKFKNHATLKGVHFMKLNDFNN